MSDLTPNHNPGAPLQPIDKEGLAKLAQQNIDNPEGGGQTGRAPDQAHAPWCNCGIVRQLRCGCARSCAADRATLDQIHRDAVKWSPVVNTYTRPARLTSELV